MARATIVQQFPHHQREIHQVGLGRSFYAEQNYVNLILKDL